MPQQPVSSICIAGVLVIGGCFGPARLIISCLMTDPTPDILRRLTGWRTPLPSQAAELIADGGRRAPDKLRRLSDVSARTVLVLMSVKAKSLKKGCPVRARRQSH